MTKYDCRLEGTITVEADNAEAAREIAYQKGTHEWDWDSIEVEEDDEEDF